MKKAKKISGFTIVELMVSMAISLVILGALVSLFVSTSRVSSEMAKVSGLIENGRFAVQIIESDLVHAGYWGGYVPQFDDLGSVGVPNDVPTAVPNPCTTYANWDRNFRINLMGIPVQAWGATMPSGAGCAAFPAKRAGTDTLLVRHADMCIAGSANCPQVAGRLYFQSPLCDTQRNAAALQQVASVDAAFNPNNIVFTPASSSSTDDAYVGMMLRTSGGTGAGQYRLITDYDGSSRTAAISPNWSPAPSVDIYSNPTTYSFEYLLRPAASATEVFPLRQGNCLTAAPMRRYISNIYYVTDASHPDRPGETIPTLVRSQFDGSSGAVQQAPEMLVEGIEQFRIELGIDDTMTRCSPATAVNYGAARSNVEPSTCTSNAGNSYANTLPINRGDGAPDRYKRCTDANPCTAQELANTVSVRIYVLARSRDQTPAYTDAKSYCLGELSGAGTCPAESLVPAANDHYTRHVFASTVRLVNVSARRETP
ncbi:PilW family protein [Solimonas fluminis]|nr:PilW family protein [Solimonas fluminis]